LLLLEIYINLILWTPLTRLSNTKIIDILLILLLILKIKCDWYEGWKRTKCLASAELWFKIQRKQKWQK
jgi:hypothetical protein